MVGNSSTPTLIVPLAKGFVQCKTRQIGSFFSKALGMQANNEIEQVDTVFAQFLFRSGAEIKKAGKRG